jgi:hypothetical protein
MGAYCTHVGGKPKFSRLRKEGSCCPVHTRHKKIDYLEPDRRCPSPSDRRQSEVSQMARVTSPGHRGPDCRRPGAKQAEMEGRPSRNLMWG